MTPEFRELNGVSVAIGEDALVELVLEVAQGRAGKAAIAAAFRATVG